MSEYQHKLLLEQVCQSLDGWQVSADAFVYGCELIHTSGAHVAVRGETQLNFSVCGAEYKNKRQEPTYLGRGEISISAQKSPERIARELHRRLLDAFLPAYERTLATLQAEVAKEEAATAFLRSVSPLFPEASIGGKSETPTLYFSCSLWYEKEITGLRDIEVSLSSHYKDFWEINLTGYGKEALKKLLAAIAATQPEPGS